MPWKMDGDSIVVSNGMPVWIDETGNESGFDGQHALTKISELNSESKGRKLKIREMEERLNAFGDIDPDLAKKSIEIAKKIDAKALIDAGEVDKVKAEIQSRYEAQVSELQKAVEEKDSILNREIVGGNFARSEFIKGKLILPADIAQKTFGDRFKIKDGKVVGLDQNGQEIYSRTKPGDLADFDEALSVIVDSYPSKAAIMRGSDAKGTGTQGGSPGGAKVLTKAAFDGLTPSQKQTFFLEEGGKIEG